VLVVDSSDDDSTRAATEELRGKYPAPVRYLHTEPGLARQRMAGVDSLAEGVDVVHFLDDDSIPESGYFEAIQDAFSARPDAVGVGGSIVDAVRGVSPLLDRLFLLDSPRAGAVLPSGRSTLGPAPNAVSTETRVDWLSGCCMSYRAGLVRRLSFDTRQIGYGFAEDVDFGYRASRIGALYVAPRARVSHRPSLGGATDLRALARAEVLWRHQYVHELRCHGLSVGAFWWSVFGAVTLYAVRGLFRFKRSYVRRAVAVAGAALEAALRGPVPCNPRIPDGPGILS
jgi:GT2 family glycosyltransferase